MECKNCTFINKITSDKCEICENILTEKIFYIYTSGLYNWGDDFIINSWNTKVKNHIINIIPMCFKIIIIHYDPCYKNGLDNNNLPIESRINSNELDIIHNTATNICKRDIENNRVLKSNFNFISFKSDTISEPHLIIDFSHIFTYIDVGIVNTTSQVFDFDKCYINKKLNVIYPGYLENKENGYKSIDLIMSKLVNIDEQGNVITFIDNLIKLGYSDFQYYPDHIIKNIHKNIRFKIMQSWRKISKDGLIGDEFNDTIYTQQDCSNLTLKIIDYIMENISSYIDDTKENFMENICIEILDIELLFVSDRMIKLLD